MKITGKKVFLFKKLEKEEIVVTVQSPPRLKNDITMKVNALDELEKLLSKNEENHLSEFEKFISKENIESSISKKSFTISYHTSNDNYLNDHTVTYSSSVEIKKVFSPVISRQSRHFKHFSDYENLIKKYLKN